MSQTSAGDGVSNAPLEAEHTVGKINVLDFLRWAKESNDWMTSDPKPTPPDKGVLALPPVQRTAVWTPKQVVDLWDSALRGLPLGTLFLVPRPSGTARALGADAPNQVVGDGWDLLDGQQRTRSLLLGVRGPELRKNVQDKRCLWIDLAGKPQSHLFSLHLTSESQPFGYETGTGRKLPVENRRKARNSIEPEPDKNPIKKDGRPAFNHELFSGPMQGELTPSQTPKGWKPGWPPLPAHAVNSTAVFPLHILLQAWLRGNTPEEKLRILREKAPDSEQSIIAELHTAFEKLRKAEFATVKVDNDDNLLLLFDRIGAAGSPLTGDERLFSIYKRYEPRVHDAVNEIYQSVGRVLPPTKIAASAIRIANARTHQEPGQGNFLPDAETFAKEMADKADPRIKRTESIRSALQKLLPMQRDERSLATAFGTLFDALGYRGKEDIGLPRVMLTSLSPNLLQVLLLWVLQQSGPDVLRDCRSDVIRFVMFWRLCVPNEKENKASGRCFEAIRKETPTGITMKALYDLLVNDSEIAVRLASPRVMRPCLVRSKGSHRWLSHRERFDLKGTGPIELARRWWESREASLLWLQRGYLKRSFPDFDPASGRDDDTPYDLDHMIPRSDWNEDWRPFSKKLKATGLFGGDELRQMWENRSVIGDAIGNLWLVDFSTNRAWGKAPFKEKIERLVDEGDRQCASNLSYRDMAFDRDAERIWLGASDIDRKWSRDRLIGFQQAVEERAAWLYERFYTDLNFSEFESDCSASISPSADTWPCALAPDDERELEAAE
jgi:Protein of unknown function DUF262